MVDDEVDHGLRLLRVVEELVEDLVDGALERQIILRELRYGGSGSTRL